MVDVSIILPVYNAEPWLQDCLDSIKIQDFNGKMELSVFDDSSTDQSREILLSNSKILKDRGITVNLIFGEGGPKGVGYAKNMAVKQSTGKHLCFLDADDRMSRNRISLQNSACTNHDDLLVGSCFHREPSDSTPRYTHWANNLSPTQLHTQVYTSFGPTLIMPTWFCHRKVFDRAGGFDEAGKGTPEDLLFFYMHLEVGGRLCRVEEDLLMYRYHPAATTFSVSEDSIWNIRMSELERKVLSKWKTFTIWNAGKQGRKFYRSLSSENKKKVQAFCDVDVKKINKGVYIYEESETIPKPRVPILHFSVASPPFIICVKIDMTGGNFEQNLKSLHLEENTDYIHFS